MVLVLMQAVLLVGCASPKPRVEGFSVKPTLHNPSVQSFGLTIASSGTPLKTFDVLLTEGYGEFAETKTTTYVNSINRKKAQEVLSTASMTNSMTGYLGVVDQKEDELGGQKYLVQVVLRDAVNEKEGKIYDTPLAQILNDPEEQNNINAFLWVSKNRPAKFNYRSSQIVIEVAQEKK